MAFDQTQIDSGEYDAIYDNENLGFTVMDQTQADVGMKYVKIESAAQFQGIIAGFKIGAAPSVKLQMLQTAYASIFGKIGGTQFYPVVDTNGSLAWWVGNRKINIFNVAKTLRLHPTQADTGDFANDIFFHLAVPDFSTLKYIGMREKERMVELSFFILPNRQVSIDKTYAAFGDWSAVEADPYSIFISSEQFARAPFNQTSALSILSNQKQRVFAEGFYKTNTGVTFLLNNGAGMTITEFTAIFDTLSTPSGLAVDDYILNGTEVMRITAIVYATSTTGTITVTRHIGGTVAATHADNSTFTLLSGVSVIDVSSRATWASDQTGRVTVGNSNSLEDKGLLTWAGTAGAANITAVVGATTSATLVATAIA